MLWKSKGRISIRKGFALFNNHLHPVGKQEQQWHQQGSLHFVSTITYNLWEGNGGITISKGICTLQAQALTSCEKEIAASTSAWESACCNHLHTVRRQAHISIRKGVFTLQPQSLTRCGKAGQDQHQQEGLHFPSTITYCLCEARSPSAWAWKSALCKHNHLHAVGRQRQHHHHQGHCHFTSTITYNLEVGKGSIRINMAVCTLQAQ